MVVYNWLLQTISDLFNRHELELADAGPVRSISTRDNHNQNFLGQFAKAQLKAQSEWFGAIEALERLLLKCLQTLSPEESQCQGLFISGTAPVLSNEILLDRFQTAIFTPGALKNNLALMPFQLPAERQLLTNPTPHAIAELPLLPNDPIAKEQFCLVFATNFALAMVLGEDERGFPAFHFSFEPELIGKIWLTLRSRLVLTNHHQIQQLDDLVEQFAPCPPDYRLVTFFSRQLLENLPPPSIPAPIPTRCVETVKTAPVVKLSQKKIKTKPTTTELPQSKFAEVELLQALTHEIRTPLTTIRTLTRLLLKKGSNLTADIIKRLESIDRECSEQIERMELIFRAADLETNKNQVQLIPISLEQLCQDSIPRWQQKAQRRNVVLDFVLPQKLPQVVSDPTMLDQVLTGLMENFTRSLPSGGRIQVRVTTAGNQLKLQFVPESVCSSNPFKSLGQLLRFQPETGSLSLNLDVTKNLFQALGGKLIVRQRPQQGEVVTVFLPLGKSEIESQLNLSIAP